jgi:hypothetical protein
MNARTPSAHAAATADTNVFAVCPYSEETLAGCRFYRAASQHAAYPGAADCRSAIALSGPIYLRRRACRRGIDDAALEDTVVSAIS